MAELRGVERPRHYGDPAAEYAAATGDAAVVDRSFRARLLVGGRAPGQMLNGVVTGSIPPGPQPVEHEVGHGRRSYSAILTPKGRMVSDLRILTLDLAGEGAPAAAVGGPMVAPASGAVAPRLLLDVPAEGAEGVRAHFARYLPPRFATVEDVTERTGMLTVIGPASAALLAREAMGLRAEPAALLGWEEDEYYVLALEAGSTLHVMRTGEVGVPAYDVVSDRGVIADLWTRLLELGTKPAGHGVWETLRIEAGRPSFGADMDEGTIPIEAGIQHRAIDDRKGCYTGQEVIIRIRDRGHVNRYLRGLKLGQAPTPPAGTELFAPQIRTNRPVGTIRTAVQSPRFGETLALAFVRREIEPGAEVRVGADDGASGLVTDLTADDGAWC